MEKKLIKVGITVGDINGIGLEVIMKTLMNNEVFNQSIPIIYGSSRTLSFHKKALDLNDFNFMPIQSPDQANQKKINLISCWKDEVEIELGVQNAIGGKYALQSLTQAVEDLKANKIDVLVTAPINKDTVKEAGFEFPGHTEYLAHQFNSEEYLMLMVADQLRVAVVTGHIPLSKVPEQITKENIERKLRLFLASLRKDFLINKPKIAVLGLNPHAGDRGALGKEEIDIINPVVRKLQDEGEMVFGSYSADGFFGSSNLRNFDGILSMFHDQGLTGFKSIAFDEGVNFTAGLPIVRTSPDHGTAFDIAGKNTASPHSFRNAYFAACDIYLRRNLHQEMNENPLQSQVKDKFENKKTVE